MTPLSLLVLLQDTAMRAGSSGQQAFLDSISVRVPPPLPGGPATVARFLLNTVPQWVQIGGVILGAIIAVTLLVLGVRHWRTVLAWFAVKSRVWKTAATLVVVMIAGTATYGGVKTWNFMMHDNAFCSGCHVMNAPFQKFGDAENKHARLLCHDCHQQSIFASMKELYVWVKDRPDQIPAHANNVPNRVCAECHEKADPDSTWKRVIATAGHQVHLNGKSPLFRKLECIVCHAREVHRFKADDKTCSQSGCHDDTSIQLGAMANQTDLHCVTCHSFTAAATEGAPVDSSRRILVPTQKECLGCHQMQQRLGKFDPEQEPHKAGCGTCHNPHSQTTTFGAFQSCATSQCHAKADTLTAMHRGLPDHALENCGACHLAHTWKARATDCKTCHQDIERDRTRTRRGGTRLSGAPLRTESPPTVVAPVSWTGTPTSGSVRRAIRHGPPRASRTTITGVSRQVAVDTATFSHRRHRSLECTTCHSSTRTHGATTVRTREQCRSCHHANDARGLKCESCHSAQSIPARSQTVPMRIDDRPATERTLSFAHRDHTELVCASCHTADASRKVETNCLSCHEDHHAAGRTCTDCHADARAKHTREVHLTGCAGSGCHTAAPAAAISPTRNVCIACHTAQHDHKPGQDCAACHLANWAQARRG
ncbi:MAG: hypothetical protein MNPFHGCM_00559 [Gemmatimonadaceae bacterium]|nr:hypothetical protein [Gemmatimonadaceae bacterium]